MKRPRDIKPGQKLSHNKNNKCIILYADQTKYKSTTPVFLLQFWNVTIVTWLDYRQTKRPRNIKLGMEVTQYAYNKS